MRGCAAIALLAAGCTRILGVHDFPPEVVDTSKTCYGTMFPVCFETALSDPRTLSGAIDTDDVLCRGELSDGTPVCIIAATDLTVMDVHVHGSLPLVLVAHDQLTVAGLLDAASHAMKIGPNGSSAECIPATPGWGEDQSNLQGSAGGAGGSFGTSGGGGGGAQDQMFQSYAGGGRTNPVATVIGLRGGCAGSAGGVSSVMMGGNTTPLTPAAGGAGGGAVVLVADAIAIDGTVDASGAGGGGGATTSNRYGGGGGGGGSGGLVAIDASVVMVSGMVIAHGGGGGAGADRNLIGNPGAAGGPPLEMVAAGGVPPDMLQAGAGGNGATGTTPAQAGLSPQLSMDSGSGGGGGGTGVILSTIAIANASPAVSPP